jgi:creatinine amidohydrolase/Fe(II)-dependent formamide hydrolase-like protein
MEIPEEWNIPESLVIKTSPSKETVEAYRRLVEAGWDPHAGERETSLIMRWFSETLRDEEDIGGYVPVVESVDEFRRKAGSDWREYYPLGYVGEPHHARRDKGELYVFDAIDTAKAIIETLNR